MSTRIKGSIVYNRQYGTWSFLYRQAGTNKRTSRQLGHWPNDDSGRAEAAKRAYALGMELRFAPRSIPRIKDLVEGYRASKMPKRYSTSRVYESWLKNYILPRWGEWQLTELDPQPVEEWILSLPLSSRSMGSIRGLLHGLWKFAMWSKAVPVQANPISLVTIEGSSKRERNYQSLTVEEFKRFMEQLDREPFRTITLMQAFTGLRISECLALRWSDLDWINAKLFVMRSIVRQREGDTKTEYSRKPLPIDAELLEILKGWKSRTEFGADGDWIFASPVKLGRQPWSYDQAQREVRRAALAAGINLNPAEIFGTHSMRNSFRSYLDAVGASLSVQQKLMRHADIRTTMNVYGDVVTDELREAHSKVVRMALPRPN